MNEDPIYFDERGNVICQLCQKPFNIISPTHLKKEHGLTFEGYKSQFPGAPISGEKFSKTMTFARTKLFNEKEEPIDMIPQIESVLEENFEEKLKEFSNYRKPKTFTSDGGVIPKGKLDILNFLLAYFDEIENNYFVEKYTLSGHLDYRLVTDIVDLKRKIDFEFPNAFWHNKDVAKPHRDLRLTGDGWTIVEILSKSPNVKEVEEELRKKNLI